MANQLISNIDIEQFDKNNFMDMLNSFPGQIDEIVNSKDIVLNYVQPNYKFNNILICGMGGSAIGGDTVKSLISNDMILGEIPICINRDYSIPGWVDSHTLVIFSSYSGNTEETISCYQECLSRNSLNVIMTSGGQLLDIAIKEKIPYSLIPEGYMPRQALGYSVSILLKIFHQYDIIDFQIITDLSDSVQSLNEQSDKYSIINTDKNKAINLARKIFNKFNVIYTSQRMEVVGLRFRAQLAENAKILSTHFVFPEQNHNEIEAFQNLFLNTINIIWIDDISNHKKISKRMDITKKILTNLNHIDVSFEGDTYLNRQMKLIYFLDWVSYYCAIYNKTDPYPVNLISNLKSSL